MTEAKVQSIYDLQDEYSKFITKLRLDGGFDLSAWLPDFKEFVRPIFPGELIVIMADTGVGKTAILQNIAKSSRGYGELLMFELELPGTLCFERFAALASDNGQARIAEIYGDEGKVNIGDVDHIFICDKAGMSLDDMYDLASSEAAKGNKFDVILIDYIGLIESKGRSRYERMSETAEQLKTFARNLDAVVVVATQIHRKGDDYVDAVGVHDAKDSGSIENTADLLLGAWRDAEDSTKLCMKILKNRKGKGGDIINARFDGPTMSITPWHERVNISAMGDAWEPGDD